MSQSIIKTGDYTRALDSPEYLRHLIGDAEKFDRMPYQYREYPAVVIKLAKDLIAVQDGQALWRGMTVD